MAAREGTITATALLLVFGCSVSWSALDLTRKLLAPHLSPLQAVFWVAAGQAPVVVAWALMAPVGALTPRYALVAGGSVALNLVANTAFVAALARAPFSLTVPLLSLIPVMTAGFAQPLLRMLGTGRLLQQPLAQRQASLPARQDVVTDEGYAPRRQMPAADVK